MLQDGPRVVGAGGGFGGLSFRNGRLAAHETIPVFELNPFKLGKLIQIPPR
jgi:hypothetical protein